MALRNSTLSFEATVENNSDFFVEAVDYPYFGDFHPPAPDALVEAHHLWTGALVAEEIYPHFVNAKGYCGGRYPKRDIESCQSQSCFLQTPSQRIYVAIPLSSARRSTQRLWPTANSATASFGPPTASAVWSS